MFANSFKTAWRRFAHGVVAAPGRAVALLQESVDRELRGVATGVTAAASLFVCPAAADREAVAAWRAAPGWPRGWTSRLGDRDAATVLREERAGADAAQVGATEEVWHADGEVGISVYPERELRKVCGWCSEPGRSMLK